MVKVDVAAYGSGLQNALKSAPGGLYMTNGSAPLGKNTGLRQDYRWGVLNSCAYTKDSGICNGTTFPVEFQPLKVILSDTPMKYYVQTNDIIPDEASNFRSESFNGNLSKVAFGMMVVSQGVRLAFQRHQLMRPSCIRLEVLPLFWRSSSVLSRLESRLPWPL